jgi:hypothetical protein
MTVDRHLVTGLIGAGMIKRNLARLLSEQGTGCREVPELSAIPVLPPCQPGTLHPLQVGLVTQAFLSEDGE